MERPETIATGSSPGRSQAREQRASRASRFATRFSNTTPRVGPFVIFLAIHITCAFVRGQELQTIDNALPDFTEMSLEELVEQTSLGSMTKRSCSGARQQRKSPRNRTGLAADRS